MIANLVLVLAIRFFLFDFVLFKKIRNRLNSIHYVFRKLFACTFCQGFWCGLAVSLVKAPVPPFWPHLEFALISAILSFTWTVVMFPYISRYEDEHDIRMT